MGLCMSTDEPAPLVPSPYAPKNRNEKDRPGVSFCCHNELHGNGSIRLDRGDISIQFFDQFPDFDIVLHIQEETI